MDRIGLGSVSREQMSGVANVGGKANVLHSSAAE